jgi:hypothetical protein
MSYQRFFGQNFSLKLKVLKSKPTLSIETIPALCDWKNGKASSGKHTCHFHIKFFYITDLINRNKIQIKYCPSTDMIADYMTKPLVGVKFEHLRKLIMNLLSNTAIIS